MPAITTSFQRPSPSPSVLLARQRDSWSPPGGGGLAASSLGRRPAVARDPAPSCGVATPQSAAAGTRHPRRNSVTATVRPHPVSSTSDGCDVTKYTGCDVTGDAGSDVIGGGRRGSVSACSGGGSRSTEHRDSRFATTLPFPEPQMSFVAVHTHTHTHPFNGPLSGTTRVSRYQKGKTNLGFNGARDSEWQWHQLGRMQVCTSLQTDNHASTPPLSFFTGRMPFLPPNQQRHSTVSTLFVTV